MQGKPVSIIVSIFGLVNIANLLDRTLYNLISKINHRLGPGLTNSQPRDEYKQYSLTTQIKITYTGL